MSSRRPLLRRLFGQKTRELPESIQIHLSLRKAFDHRQNISTADFVSFDTELTGLDFRRDSIISIGAVRLKGTSILTGKTFYRLVKPESELKHTGVLVHELTHSDLAQADQLADVIEEFIEFIGSSVLIGHFIDIDRSFVNRALKDLYGCTLQSHFVDTSSLHDWLYENDSRFARHHGGMTVKTDLFSLAKKYGIEVKQAHNAFQDAYVTAQLFQRFVPFLMDCGINTVNELSKVGRP